MPQSSLATKFQFIPEYQDEFLALFPHRHDFIWAKHYSPGESVEWHSENRHPLSDRLINQGAHLYGVRFADVTHYLMTDIDLKSPYHPCHDPFAIPRILAALESLGLYSHIAVTSSYSGGIHLYFPFALGMPSWAIAQAASLLLEHHGFKIKAGHLELFPNSRGYGEELTNYNGHRLPLQAGSYLLDADWQPTFTTREAFVQQWRFAQNKNHVDRLTIDRVIAQHDRYAPRRIRKGSARKFLADLNAEIEQGWTGFGQTNHILGRIAIREYVFRHCLSGGQPLTGTALSAQILEIAISLPGYNEWCRHHCDLTQWCEYWARSVQNSNYYPYGSRWKEKTEVPPLEPTWNEKQAQDARSRISSAVTDLLAEDQLPNGVRARLLLLKGLAGCSTDTLYKNKDLWHPEFYCQQAIDSQQEIKKTEEKSLKPLPDKVIQADQDDTTSVRSLQPLPSNMIQPIGINKLCAASEPTPSALGSDGTPPMAVGGRGGLSTGVDSIKQVLAAIATRKVLQPPPAASPPPDEDYFIQLQLTNLVGAITNG